MKFPRDIKGAKKVQRILRQKVKLVPLIKGPEFIAGVDAAFYSDNVIAAACLYKYPELVPVEDAYAVSKITFPYIPGFLSFREGPAILRAIARLKKRPEVVIFDGQGIAHPECMGIAAHIGVLLDMPSVGCAKSRLVGEYSEPGKNKGQHTRLRYRNQSVGAVLRTRNNVRPVFVSPGHLIDLKTAVDIVLNCTSKFRLPEPVRRADSLSKKLRQEMADQKERITVSKSYSQ
jgi:deoxyribonuclease V